MPTAVRISLALLAMIVAVGMPASAIATPVVDQYTEQLPSPGGPKPVGQNNPGNPGKGTGTDNNVGSSGTETPGGEGSTGSDASTNPTGTAGEKEQSDAAITADGERPVNEEDDSLGAAATSGSDDGGDGMGWVFPAALVLVAAVIAGIAIVRRNRGNLAT